MVSFNVASRGRSVSAQRPMASSSVVDTLPKHHQRAKSAPPRVKNVEIQEVFLLSGHDDGCELTPMAPAVFEGVRPSEGVGFRTRRRAPEEVEPRARSSMSEGVGLRVRAGMLEEVEAFALAAATPPRTPHLIRMESPSQSALHFVRPRPVSPKPGDQNVYLLSVAQRGLDALNAVTLPKLTEVVGDVGGREAVAGLSAILLLRGLECLGINVSAKVESLKFDFSKLLSTTSYEKRATAFLPSVPSVLTRPKSALYQLCAQGGAGRAQMNNVYSEAVDTAWKSIINRFKAVVDEVLQPYRAAARSVRAVGSRTLVGASAGSASTEFGSAGALAEKSCHGVELQVCKALQEALRQACAQSSRYVVEKDDARSLDLNRIHGGVSEVIVHAAYCAVQELDDAQMAKLFCSYVETPFEQVRSMTFEPVVAALTTMESCSVLVDFAIRRREWDEKLLRMIPDSLAEFTKHAQASFTVRSLNCETAPATFGSANPVEKIMRDYEEPLKALTDALKELAKNYYDDAVRSGRTGPRHPTFTQVSGAVGVTLEYLKGAQSCLAELSHRNVATQLLHDTIVKITSDPAAFAASFALVVAKAAAVVGVGVATGGAGVAVAVAVNTAVTVVADGAAGAATSLLERPAPGAPFSPFQARVEELDESA